MIRRIKNWWNGYDITLLSYSMHHIVVEVADPNGVDRWYACGIYGWAERSQKHKTWDLMCIVRNACKGPCLFFGDFNEILSTSEKMGDNVRCENDMVAFRNCMDAYELRDLGFRGGFFTRFQLIIHHLRYNFV